MAGKSTLNWLERNKLTSTPTTRSATIRSRSGRCWSTCSWRRMRGLPGRSFSTSMRWMIRCTASRKGVSSTAITIATAACRFTCSAPPSARRQAAACRPGRGGRRVEEITRIVAQVRRRWPRVRILLRADSGFARDDLMAWCEANGVDFLFGLGAQRAVRLRDRHRA